MVVVMRSDAREEDVLRVVMRVQAALGEAYVVHGKFRTIIGLVGDTEAFLSLPWSTLPGVDHVVQVGKPYKLVARELHPALTTVRIGNAEVGRAGRPVLLKRGLSATVEEWIMAAEHIAQQGNSDIVLCERGIRTFEPSTRNTLDLAGMVVAQQETHLPVIVDPSHATGRRDLVPAMARAALAAGADGIMVDVHPTPSEALCDGPQALTPDDLVVLVAELSALARALGRPVNVPAGRPDEQVPAAAVAAG